ncbi:hypothetical protein Ngar_c09630 [Candidatus Nitrososphaera gargensis Ga9.2]|uniref:Transposase n=1 Tax=Nitrososphaera gargensis (strain Ga9.2) TaxID=1237085 RepID=K0IDU3_NITGG|nr:hypothetical protein Ngar_c09630 [Candidatus Nitrososphaera gargensis Ga9.2]
MMLEQRDYSQLFRELEYYRNRCSELEAENKQLKEELHALKSTVSAVVARSVDARQAARKKKRHKKPGQKKGHAGKSRKRPEHIDARVTIDQTSCRKCGSALSERPTDSYSRVVTDIVPARPVVRVHSQKEVLLLLQKAGVSTCTGSTPKRGVRAQADAPDSVAKAAGTVL